MYPKKCLWLLFLLMTILKWILPDHKTSTKACVQVSMHTPSVFTEIAEEFDAWWHHQMETFSALLAICAGNSPVNSPHKCQWRGALMFSLICVWINDWVNNRETGDLRRYRVHYDVIVMEHDLFHHSLETTFCELPNWVFMVSYFCMHCNKHYHVFAQ